MEHTGGTVDKVGIRTQFQSIDEVQNMIRHLQKIEEDMKKKDGDENNGKKLFTSFEDLTILDESEYKIDENETEWLTKVPGSKKMSAKDLEGDESFIDSGLLNVRFGLLNFIKSVLIEEKSTKFNTSPRYHSAGGSSSQFCRRQTPPLTHTTVPLRSTSPPTLFHTYSPRSNAAALTTQGSSENSPVSSSSANRSSFEFLSPHSHPPVREEKPEVDTNHLYFSTPANKQIDSRTYTRPKKNRLPLETYSDHLELPMSPIRIVQPEAPVVQANAVDTETANHNQNMNETFVASDDIIENHKAQEESSPPRRVTRNLSYVIRRDSESPNNNSPVHMSENIENIAVDLNSTFVRTREGTYSPSPTGSSNSIHTSSMEELHNLARIQEQSLRMSSNPKMLTRKDTHTIVRAAEQPTLRPINKPPNESQIPGQPKLRIQSRIPALGAGSRIRPPVNGATRRPITSGGIRRAPDWRDEGAY